MTPYTECQQCGEYAMWVAAIKMYECNDCDWTGEE